MAGFFVSGGHHDHDLLRPLARRAGEGLALANFSPAEIACRGTGKLLINEPALDKLQALRDRLGKPLIVRSAYRSPEHNRAVGGATRSKHMDGAAFDIAMSNHDPVAFEAAARAGRVPWVRLLSALGVHACRPRPGASVGRAVPGPGDCFRRGATARARGLGDSRTMKGGGAAGVATLGAAGVEVAQSVLAETQIRRPAAGALSRHASLGVHRRGARWHRGHDLRPPR